MYCNKHTLVKWHAGQITARPLRCKCWSCKQCAPWRARLLQQEALAGKPSTFITLTCNPNFRGSAAERAQNLVDAWRKCVRRLRAMKRYSKLQFIAVMERTQKGEPHLHILARMAYFKQSLLSDWMREFSDAPIVWIEYVRNKQKIAAYVAKYVSKGPYRYTGCKRYWRTMDYMHPTRAELRAQRPDDVVWYLVDSSYTVYRDVLKNSEAVITRDWYSSIQATAPPAALAPPKCLPLRSVSK